MFYSPSTNGFYDRTIHTEIPADAVEISVSDHAALLEGQGAGKRIIADSNGRPALADPPARTREQIIAGLESAVQSELDRRAQERNYDNIVSACSYAGAPNAFQAESQAFLAWRAACWQHCYQVLADCQSETRPIPTPPELIAELPALLLP